MIYIHAAGCQACLVCDRGMIRKQQGEKVKESGVEKLNLPMFIPERLLHKEKDHEEDFVPEPRQPLSLFLL